MSVLLGAMAFVLALTAFTLAAINYRRSCDRLRAIDAALAVAEANLAAAQRAEEERAARVRSKWQGPT